MTSPIETKIIKKAQQIAYQESQKTGSPIKEHIDLSVEIGLKLAKKLNANAAIVHIGTLMMDCLLGQTILENQIQAHVKRSVDKTNKMLNEFDLSVKDKENILHCVSQHHGAKKFYSIEAEICCNADCYRFISTQGFLIALHQIQDLPFNELLQLLKDKAEEKHKALSLAICKTELEPQYQHIKSILSDAQKLTTD